MLSVKKTDGVFVKSTDNIRRAGSESVRAGRFVESPHGGPEIQDAGLGTLTHRSMEAWTLAW